MPKSKAGRKRTNTCVRKFRLKKVNRTILATKKICPQCQNVLNRDSFSANVHTEDGLSLCCDSCYLKAHQAFVQGETIEPTCATVAAFTQFVDFQNEISGR